MPKGIIKIKDKYFEWSTISDAPTTYSMSLEELHEYIKEEYGNVGLKDLPERLERVEKWGSSFITENLNDTIRFNRAGDNEDNISKNKIYEKYAQPVI